MTRPYELKKRGQRQDQTRQKIVEAAIHLHQAQGIAATSMNDIAAQAGVGKVTVYRHFPNMATMVGACSGQYFERNPLPDFEAWRSIADPRLRLEQALGETYDYFKSIEAMMTSVYAEARDHPIMAPYHAHWRSAAELLVKPWAERGRQKVLLKAAIALALDFETWRRLVLGEGLTNAQAAALMVRLTCDCDLSNR